MKNRKNLGFAIICGVCLVGPVLLYTGYHRYERSGRQLMGRIRTMIAMKRVHAQGQFRGLTAQQASFCCDPSDAACKPTMQTTIVMRADGGTAGTTVEGRAGNPRVLSIHANDHIYTVHHQVSAFTVIPSSRTSTVALQGAMGNPATNCEYRFDATPRFPLGDTYQGIDTVLGYRTHKFVAKTPSSVVTYWLAPDLGCFEIQKDTSWTDGAKNKASRTRVVTLSVVEGTPDPSAFQVPQGYQEMKPSDLFRAVEIAKFMSAGMSQADAQTKADAYLAKNGQGLQQQDNMYLLGRQREGR